MQTIEETPPTPANLAKIAINLKMLAELIEEARAKNAPSLDVRRMRRCAIRILELLG